MTLILGIDTSGLAGSVALLRDGIVLEQRSLEQAGRRHAQTLVAECASVLAAHQVAPYDLSAAAVTCGPGSFTGLRVGIVCAKTLAYALGIPLITLDTFDIVAAQCPAEWSTVWMVEDAQRQEVYTGQYVRDASGDWRLQGERVIAPSREWLSKLKPDDIVVGPGVSKLPAELIDARIVQNPVINVPRAETVCRLAMRKLAAGDVDDCYAAKPFYIRLSGAEEKAALKTSRGN